MYYLATALLVVLALTAAHAQTFSSDPVVARREMADYVNSIKTTWTAEVHPRFEFADASYTKSLCGSLPESADQRLQQKQITPLQDLPSDFDSRTQWPNCPTIQEVRDQSACGSCWAFASAEAASDRLCIGSNGAYTQRLSSEDLLSCCGFQCGQGCGGGYPSAAWKWFTTTGVATGGAYQDYDYCVSYSLEPCYHHVSGSSLPQCSNYDFSTPKCQKQCDSASTYNSTYTDDKATFKFSKSYSISSKVEEIQTEIMTNGPVGASFTVYADFESYSSGVYQHVSGSNLGGHAVKIIGWGVDGTTPYWLVANSWNTSWGLDGFFKILRGSNECGIEGGLVAGTL
jgi:cathepsin B